MTFRVLLLATLALSATLVVLVPAGSAQTNDCYYVWYPSPPPGWITVCDTLAWLGGNPVTPLAGCVGSKVHVTTSPLGVTVDWATVGSCLP